MILGITGCPGSGKSTLAREIASHGWELIDADMMGKAVVNNSPVVIKMLVSEFGSDIVGDNGHLNRSLLAERAFTNTDTVKRLNGIVHPVLVTELTATIAQLRENGANAVIDCALIFEWNIESEFDYVVTVSADEETRIGRIRTRDGRPDSVIRGITAAQLPESEKVTRADIVLKNDSGIGRLESLGRMLAELKHH